jgi:hypothetical protein
LKACIEQVEAERHGATSAPSSSAFARDPPSHITAGILLLAYPEVDVELEVEPSAFLHTVDESETLTTPYADDPEFQPYFAQAWASFQADKAGVKSKDRPGCCTSQVNSRYDEGNDMIDPIGIQSREVL